MSDYQRLYTEEFTEIGLIRRSHGYKGHAKVSIIDDYLDDLKRQSFVFLEIDGYKVPFKIDEISDEKHVILKLKGCDDSETIGNYQLVTLHLLSQDILMITDESLSKPHRLVHMMIEDINQGTVGKIMRIEEYPQQLMAIVLIASNKEVMIPLHDSLIIDANYESKIIKMDLPEGLI